MSEPSLQPLWYCVHTKPKSEHLAGAAIRMLDAEIETYCPRIRFQRATPRGKVWFTEALFPSYMFARFDLATWLRGVKHANHVIGIVGFGGKAMPVDDRIITDLRSEMRGQELREVRHGVKVGDAVEVAEGPMRGLKGIVESLASGEERVRILLEFLGRTSVVEVPAGKLLSERSPREALSPK
jgi:transcription antitermination factor NusG